MLTIIPGYEPKAPYEAELQKQMEPEDKHTRGSRTAIGREIILL